MGAQKGYSDVSQLGFLEPDWDADTHATYTGNNVRVRKYRIKNALHVAKADTRFQAAAVVTIAKKIVPILESWSSY